MMKKVKILMFILLGLSQNLNAQDNTYYIGHSGFGWDLIVGAMVDDLATDTGITGYNYGFQFIGGTCIANQWVNHASPQGGTDSWVELATGNYDNVVLAEQIPIQEVIYGSPWCNSTIMTSVEAIDSFYDMAVTANANTRMFLMEFHNEVDQTGPTPFATWAQLNADMRPLWEQVADSVALVNPGGPQVCLVPVAAAFEALADSVLAGSYPGITDWIELFDPADALVATIHPTEETYYLVACVHYAVLFGQSPVGLTNITFAADGFPFDPPTPAQALMMQEIAWEIVSNDPYTCFQSTAGVINEELPKVSIYPNPSTGEVNIELNIENGSLEIYDFSGKSVQNSFFNQKVKLNLQLEPGIYLIVIYDANGNKTTEKWIVY